MTLQCHPKGEEDQRVETCMDPSLSYTARADTAPPVNMEKLIL